MIAPLLSSTIYTKLDELTLILIQPLIRVSPSIQLCPLKNVCGGFNSVLKAAESFNHGSYASQTLNPSMEIAIMINMALVNNLIILC